MNLLFGNEVIFWGCKQGYRCDYKWWRRGDGRVIEWNKRIERFVIRLKNFRRSSHRGTTPLSEPCKTGGNTISTTGWEEGKKVSKLLVCTKVCRVEGSRKSWKNEERIESWFIFSWSSLVSVFRLFLPFPSLDVARQRTEGRSDVLAISIDFCIIIFQDIHIYVILAVKRNGKIEG